jgi:hypothetical protein
MEILENLEQWKADYQAGFLAHYRATGDVDFRVYPRIHNAAAPAGPAVDLARSRLMLVSSAGLYLCGTQEPFDATNKLGDYTVRALPVDSPRSDWAIAHTHYDHAAFMADPQVLVPLGYLRAMIARGDLASMTPSVISFMGYQPDAARVALETAPTIARLAQQQRADAVLLVPA